MCLIYLAHRVDPVQRLVVAANRDEFHDRPSAPAHWWDDSPGVLAGRDLQAGGTWLGVSRTGRFAAITNFRDPAHRVADPRSRGFLVSAFLRGDEPALAYLERIAAEGARYNGFSLLTYDGDRLGFYSNRDGVPVEVAPGVHGLSNHLLDTPWPKVEQGKLDLLGLLARGRATPAALLGLLDRREPDPPGAPLPPGDPGPPPAEVSRFILDPRYGTRCSTAVLFGADGGVLLRERSFDAAGEVRGDEVHGFDVGA